jgi:hypothetical protein
MTITTDVIHRVWHDNEGVAIDVGPDADALGLVWLRTHDAKAAEYFGKLSLTFCPDMARAIGEALVVAADEVERAK